MKKPIVLSMFVVLCSCMKNDIVQHLDANTDPRTLPNGLTFNFLSANYSDVGCGAGWGRKGCYFLNKYNGTLWADTENYYSAFSDIKFSLFQDDVNFISFYNIGSVTSYCNGWKKGENNYDGIKWNIELKRDEWDILWFNYEYYGTSNEIEFTITYKYEVIDGLLHFSSSENETFIFHPSEKNYSKEIIETEEIIVTEGCLFY